MHGCLQNVLRDPCMLISSLSLSPNPLQAATWASCSTARSLACARLACLACGHQPAVVRRPQLPTTRLACRVGDAHSIVPPVNAGPAGAVCGKRIAASGPDLVTAPRPSWRCIHAAAPQQIAPRGLALAPWPTCGRACMHGLRPAPGPVPAAAPPQQATRLPVRPGRRARRPAARCRARPQWAAAGRWVAALLWPA